MPDYRLNLDRAQFKPPAQDELRLQRALIDDREAANRFFMAYEEMIPPESFFNPDNLRAIMERGDKGLFPPALSVRERIAVLPCRSPSHRTARICGR
jgi:hypothetical protein